MGSLLLIHSYMETSPSALLIELSFIMKSCGFQFVMISIIKIFSKVCYAVAWTAEVHMYASI